MSVQGRAGSRTGRIATGAVIAALALLGGALPASASASTLPSITEYPIAGSENPDLIAPGLATDPAASVWVSDPYGGADGNGRVYRVEAATGAVSGTFAPPAGASVPGFLVRGPDARMWVTAADANGTLMRAAADGAFTDVTPTGGARGGLTVGPDGNVWYLNTSGGAHNGQVGFVDPSTLASQRFDIPTADSHPEEITPGPPGDPNSMWFTEESADRIGRVDTITHQVTDYGGLTAGARPNGIVVGGDGGLWFAEYGTGKIGRIDPATHQVTEYGAPGELGGPDRMTVAPGGRIWFTLFNDSEVGSFIPGPNPTFDLISTPTAGAGPSGITVGPDGHVWFAEYSNHAVARIDGSYSQLPTTTIDSGPAGTITDTTATFTFHSDDPAASFECSFDASAFAPCDSPYTTGALSLGDHTFTVRAINAAGTDPTPPSRTFTVATPPSPPVATPITRITSRPPAQTPDQVVRFTFTGKNPAQIDPYAGITFQCQLDGGPFTPCSSPYTSSTLQPASHYFQVRAVSAGGIVDPQPAAWTFRVTQPITEVHYYSCPTEAFAGPWSEYDHGPGPGPIVGRGLISLGPCVFPDIVCPAQSACLFELYVDEHDDSYLFNHDVHLQQFDEYLPGQSEYRDKLYCFAPPAATTPYDPRLELRAFPVYLSDMAVSYENYKRDHGHACHDDGYVGLVGAGADIHSAFRCEGLLHVDKPGVDYRWGGGYEQNAQLGCQITEVIQRHVTELAEVLKDSPTLGSTLEVVVPSPGSIYLSGTVHAALLSRKSRAAPPALVPIRIAARAGAVRIRLKLNAAARRLQQRSKLTLTLTTTFQPASGQAVTRLTTITLPRHSSRRPPPHGRKP